MNCELSEILSRSLCHTIISCSVSYLKQSLHNFRFFFKLLTSFYIAKFYISKGFDVLNNSISVYLYYTYTLYHIYYICHALTLTNLTFKEPLGRSRMNMESMKAKKRVVKLITIVILIFTICWLPLQVSKGHTSLIAGFLWSLNLNLYNISL